MVLKKCQDIYSLESILCTMSLLKRTHLLLILVYCTILIKEIDAYDTLNATDELKNLTCTFETYCTWKETFSDDGFQWILRKEAKIPLPEGLPEGDNYLMAYSKSANDYDIKSTLSSQYVTTLDIGVRVTGSMYLSNLIKIAEVQLVGLENSDKLRIPVFVHNREPNLKTQEWFPFDELVNSTSIQNKTFKLTFDVSLKKGELFAIKDFMIVPTPPDPSTIEPVTVQTTIEITETTTAPITNVPSPSTTTPKSTNTWTSLKPSQVTDLFDSTTQKTTVVTVDDGHKIPPRKNTSFLKDFGPTNLVIVCLSSFTFLILVAFMIKLSQHYRRQSAELIRQEKEKREKDITYMTWADSDSYSGFIDLSSNISINSSSPTRSPRRWSDIFV